MKQKLISSLLHYAALRHSLSNKQQRKINSAYVRFYRDALGWNNFGDCSHSTGDRVLDKFRAPSASDVVSICRLEYLRRLLKSDENRFVTLLSTLSCT